MGQIQSFRQWPWSAPSSETPRIYEVPEMKNWVLGMEAKVPWREVLFPWATEAKIAVCNRVVTDTWTEFFGNCNKILPTGKW